jgi:hypothetical protein
MDSGYNIPWVEVHNTMGRVQDTMGGDQNLMGRRVKIPWVVESKYNG